MQNTENKFKHDGLWYIAVEQESCTNCAFSCAQSIDHMGGCSLPRALPDCCAGGRDDNRDVIFVRSDVDNLEGEK